VQTVESLRQRLVEQGADNALNGMKREQPPTPKLWDGTQEAQVIAMRLGSPPKGYANWSLRLLARKVVEPEIVASSEIAGENPRQTLSGLLPTFSTLEGLAPQPRLAGTTTKTAIHTMRRFIESLLIP
jgi:hypothetical protein